MHSATKKAMQFCFVKNGGDGRVGNAARKTHITKFSATEIAENYQNNWTISNYKKQQSKLIENPPSQIKTRASTALPLFRHRTQSKIFLRRKTKRIGTPRVDQEHLISHYPYDVPRKNKPHCLDDLNVVQIVLAAISH